MKLLIIGSKGFIGSWVQRHFEEKHQVWGCDVVVGYGEKNYFQVDPSNNDFLEIFQQERFDACINCSGAANVSDSLVHPKRDFLLNTQNVFYLLDAIRQYQPSCKFLQLSSAALYGNPERLPIKETDRTAPISPYGWHKYQAELLCQEYFQVFGVQSAIARIFSAYGPGLKKQLFWDLYQKSLKSSTITMFGTGKETRDFIYVSDLAHALEAIVDQAPFQAEVVNVANGKQTSIEEAVETFFSHYETPLTVQFNHQVKAGDPLHWEADIQLLKRYGYTPKVGLSEGLKNVVEWARK